MPDPLFISIDGDLANSHVLPLYEGGETLSGIGLSFTRVAHYLLTSDIRHRAPYDNRLKILTRVPGPGSIEFDFIGFLSGPAPSTIIGSLTISVSAALVFEAGIFIFKKLIGKEPQQPPTSIKNLVENRPGDIDALASSILPSVKKAHTIIHHGATTININGNNNNVSLNAQTKDYVNTTIQVDDEYWIDASIAWLNGNSRTGGAYMFDLGRIVPFDVPKTISNASMNALTESHSDYFIRGTKANSRISIRVRPYCAIDGTVKRYLLLEAAEIEGD